MTLQLHRPDGEGGLEPRTVTDQDWQKQLRSPRWGQGLRRVFFNDTANTEMGRITQGAGLPGMMSPVA